MKWSLLLLFIICVLSGRKRKLPEVDDPRYASERSQANSFFRPNRRPQPANDPLQELLEPDQDELDNQVQIAENLLAQQLPDVQVQPPRSNKCY